MFPFLNNKKKKKKKKKEHLPAIPHIPTIILYLFIFSFLFWSFFFFFFFPFSYNVFLFIYFFFFFFFMFDYFLFIFFFSFFFSFFFFSASLLILFVSLKRKFIWILFLGQQPSLSPFGPVKKNKIKRKFTSGIGQEPKAPSPLLPTLSKFKFHLGNLLPCPPMLCVDRQGDQPWHSFFSLLLWQISIKWEVTDWELLAPALFPM